MRKCLICLTALAVFAAPVYADVIPARSEAKSADSDRVADRMVSLGMEAARAQELAGSLTDAEIEFFSADPECLQVVGAQDFFSGEADTFWYETVAGAIVLGATAGGIWFMFTRNE